jgi:hypothetical protein
MTELGVHRWNWSVADSKNLKSPTPAEFGDVLEVSFPLGGAEPFKAGARRSRAGGGFQPAFNPVSQNTLAFNACFSQTGGQCMGVVLRDRLTVARKVLHLPGQKMADIFQTVGDRAADGCGDPRSGGGPAAQSRQFHRHCPQCETDADAGFVSTQFEHK